MLWGPRRVFGEPRPSRRVAGPRSTQAPSQVATQEATLVATAPKVKVKERREGPRGFRQGFNDRRRRQRTEITAACP